VAEKKARARELIALGNELRRRFHEDHVGRTISVLVESAGDGLAEGTSDNYIKVRFPAAPPGRPGGGRARLARRQRGDGREMEAA
jgi:tRNA A37 methylthiotransferase MiaB